ncbi:DHA1 family inner membrane transport protein [Scopulibacillus daqui]|uniref:DHA1 family inner membrane transport protein n=1 Tax=Scopulibacillus daqui TaxID=1469162 RepID=A0ABS2PZW6_9BACL|nr:MFS transporter [Scopulibacillus daqui]MBM7645601.1 DHA1 family inner membrane transport protein [Scopulibacillus daqui]
MSTQIEEKNTAVSAKKQANGFPIALAALTIGAFAIGMTEFVIMGLLPNVASNLHVSISKAGQLITGYALGVAVGGPLLTIITYRTPRKMLLCLLMAIFIVGNALCAVSPNYTFLMIARIVAAFAHGTFFGVGSIIASSLVRPEKKASAVAIMFTGLTLANIIGVPFGTFIGQQFGWRTSFWIITFLGLIALIGIMILVPRVQINGQSNLWKEINIFRHPQVLIALLMTIFGFGGVFTAFTYITPILENITGFTEHSVTMILVLFGIGVTIGNILGGKLADWRLMPSLIANLIFLALILAVFSMTSGNKLLAVVTVFIWGIAAFAIVPSLQVRIMNVANDAPTMASTSNQSAFNLGNAGGAFLGGLAVDHTGLHSVPLIASLVTVIGLVITIVSYMIDKRVSE